MPLGCCRLNDTTLLLLLVLLLPVGHAAAGWYVTERPEQVAVPGTFRVAS